MSYCRWSKGYSDLYIYHHVDDYLICHCRQEYSFKTPLRSEMIKHIADHKVKGDIVPDHPTERLLEEIADEGDEI